MTQSELAKYATTKGGMVDASMVSDLFGPLFWMYFDDHQDMRIFHIKLRWGVFRPSASVYLRDIRPWLERVFGPHP